MQQSDFLGQVILHSISMPLMLRCPRIRHSYRNIMHTQRIGGHNPQSTHKKPFYIGRPPERSVYQGAIPQNTP